MSGRSALLCALVALFAQLGCLAQPPVDQVALGISEQIERWFNSATDFEGGRGGGLQSTYNTFNGSLEQPDGASAITNISQTLSEDFMELEQTLQLSLALARELYTPFFDTECCSRVCIRGEDYNITACSEICDLSANTSRFSVYRTQAPVGVNGSGFVGMGDDMELEEELSANTSALHIPLDIYENDPVVMCFANWSRDFTPHFNEVAERLRTRHGNIAQFFGSSTGILHVHPAVSWSTLNQCYRCATPQADTYDVRDRPWYLNTVPGSKFVVILMDMSGSMTGYRSLLARLAVRQLLNSLNQNDYFLVLAVANSSRTGPLNCFNSRTRATPENILVMNDAVIRSNDTRGKAEFGLALDLAVQALSNSSECHRSIIIFTDGDTETLEQTEVDQLSSQLEGDLEEVRVFTYLVGRNGNTGTLMEIACRNRGRMSRIEEYSGIIGKVRTFFSDLRRQTPVELSNSTVFWNHYRGVLNGLSLTGSIPLIIDFDGIRDFVGVMGINVDLKNVEGKINRHNLSPLGYGFILDNNGQLILHPEIDSEYIIEDLSNDYLLSLDVSNFEHPVNPSEFELVRQAMIARESGNATMEVWLPIEREKSYVLKTVTYFYAPVESTSFSVAIVVPEDGQSYSNGASDPPSFTTPLRDSLQLQDKPYCFGPCGIDPVEQPLEFLNTVAADTEANCNPAFCLPLREDLLRTARIVFPNLSRGTDPALGEGAFVQFPSGLTLCRALARILSDMDLPWCLDYPFIRLPNLHSNHTLLFHHIPLETSAFPPYLAATRILLDANGLESALAGSVFVGTDEGPLESVYRLVIQEMDDFVDDGETQVYFLNHNATIMFSKGPNGTLTAGQHFSEQHSEVLQELVDQGVYRAVEIVGYELRPCRIQLATCTSSAQSWHKGLLFSMAKLLIWTVNGGLWMTVKLAAFSILSSIQSFTGVLFGAYAAVMTENSTCPVDLCLLRVVTYQPGDLGNGTINGTINTANATIEYQVAGVPGTDLVLVIVSGPATMQPVENESPVPCVCEGEMEEGMRAEPADDICYIYDNATYQVPAECSSASALHHPPSLPLLLLPSLLALLLLLLLLEET